MQKPKILQKPFKPYAFLWKLYLCAIGSLLLANQNYQYLEEPKLQKKYQKIFKLIMNTRCMEVINQIDKTAYQISFGCSKRKELLIFLRVT